MEEGGEVMADVLGGGGDATSVEVAGAGMAETTAGSRKAANGDGYRDKNANVDNPLLRLLQVDVIAETVFSFLHLADMKALSEASVGSLKIVRKTQQFSNQALIKISEEVMENGLVNKSAFLWKHISLDLFNQVEVLDVIEGVLHGVESVYLNLPRESLENNAVAHYLKQVLKKTKKLRTLGLETGIMNKVFPDVFSPEVQHVLSGIQCLEIRGFSEHNYSKDFPYYIAGTEKNDMPFQQNFLQLSMVPLKLKKFVFGKVVSDSYQESEYLKSIPNIVEANTETLEELELHLHVWKYDEMKGIRCPRLKRLTLSTSGNDKNSKIVEAFLKNQPPLEELAISLNSEFPVSVLLALEGKLMKMKKLHLKAKRFVGSTASMDWSFLEGMTKLKDFSVRKPKHTLMNFRTTVGVGVGAGYYGYGEEILNKLPPQIEKIALQGFQDFWNELGSLQNIGNTVAHFQNLTELNLLRSHGALTDEGLQSLISNCPKLVSLTFSHCYELSDFGISGVLPKPKPNTEEEQGEEEKEREREEKGQGVVNQPKKPGVSLDELTGLKHLKIRCCRLLTPETMLKVVKFKYLRSFDYYPYKNVALPKDFLFQIVEQNPSLEKVTLHIEGYDRDPDYMNKITEELKEKSSRVHFFEIRERARFDWEEKDSDSDASSMISDISSSEPDFFDFYYEARLRDDFSDDDDSDDSDDDSDYD